MTWFESVLPSLFPFMVLTGLLIRMNVPVLFSRFIHKNKLLHHIPVSSLFAAITGLLCGYPMGIRTVSELRNTNQLNKKQASWLISFANQAGPMFVLGYALPLCRLNEQTSRLFLIAFYGSILFTALISGCFFQLTQYKSGSKQTLLPQTVNATHRPTDSIFHLFEEVVLSSMITLTKIGGYMMLFSLILALMQKQLPGQPMLLMVIGGLLEMTSGIASAAELEYAHMPYFILGFLSFGGLCVTAQSFSLGRLETKEQLSYLFWKTLQTLLALLIFYLLNTYVSP